MTGKQVVGDPTGASLGRFELRSKLRFTLDWMRDWGGALTLLMAVYGLVYLAWLAFGWATRTRTR